MRDLLSLTVKSTASARILCDYGSVASPLLENEALVASGTYPCIDVVTVAVVIDWETLVSTLVEPH